ncbi:MAG: hypothetical protein JWM86_904 [Thermoleophilia bacterium]|nr:hypothetical protein [Thermoleophilia bacterium]
MGNGLVLLGVAMVLAGQALAIASLVVLLRMTLEALTANARLSASFFLTLGLSATSRRTTLGKALIAADGPTTLRLQRRLRLALALTLLGVLVAFGGFAL